MEEESEARSLSGFQLNMGSDSMQPTISQTHREMKSITSNIVLMSFSFLLLFTAILGIYSLQSTLHVDQSNLGVMSLCAHFAAAAVSNLVLTTFFLRRFSQKNTMICAMITFLPYGLAQFYVTPYTVVPAAIFCGLGTGPLWVSASIYIVISAKEYARLKKKSVPPIIYKGFGILYAMLQIASIAGNGTSSLVQESLYRKIEQALGFSSCSLVLLLSCFTNVGYLFLKVFLEAIHNVSSQFNLSDSCGVNFCRHQENIILSKRPEDKYVQMLIAIYITFIGGACFTLGFFVEPLDRFNRRTVAEIDIRMHEKKTGTFTNTVVLLKERKQLVIIPLNVFMGSIKAFILADFTQAYVTCSWAIHSIGFVMICYGILMAITSISMGWLVKIRGGYPLFVSACVIHFSVIIWLFFWFPSKTHVALFFISALWALGDGVWSVSFNALYGILFPHNLEAAYSNYRLWESVGQFMAFGYSSFICIKFKLIILVMLLVIGMLGYADTEVRYQKLKKERERERAKLQEEAKLQEAANTNTMQTEEPLSAISLSS